MRLPLENFHRGGFAHARAESVAGRDGLPIVLDAFGEVLFGVVLWKDFVLGLARCRLSLGMAAY
jgi:hypothetical protein